MTDTLKIEDGAAIPHREAATAGKTGLRGKLFVLTVSIVALAMGILALIGVTSVRSVSHQLIALMTNDSLNGSLYAAEELLEKMHGTLSLREGKLIDAGGKPIADHFGFVDTIHEEVGVAATIFAAEGDDFTRIITSIADAQGERIIGTPLGKDSAAYEPVSAGQEYRGQALIQGEPYFTVYHPLLTDREKSLESCS